MSAGSAHLLAPTSSISHVDDSHTIRREEKRRGKRIICTHAGGETGNSREQSKRPFAVSGETSIFYIAVIGSHSNWCCTLLFLQKAQLRLFFSPLFLGILRCSSLKLTVPDQWTSVNSKISHRFSRHAARHIWDIVSWQEKGPA